MKLIFIYNADSDFASQAKDFINKIVSPDSYPCKLCDLTHGKIKMRKEWKDFIDTSDIDMRFLHRDEFFSFYPDKKDINLPAIVKEDDSGVDIVIEKKEIDKINNIEDLKSELRSRIGE